MEGDSARLDVARDVGVWLEGLVEVGGGVETTQNSPLTCLLFTRWALNPGRPAVECLNNLMFVPLVFSFFFPRSKSYFNPSSICVQSCVHMLERRFQSEGLPRHLRSRLRFAAYASSLSLSGWLSHLVLDEDSEWPTGVKVSDEACLLIWALFFFSFFCLFYVRGWDGSQVK